MDRTTQLTARRTDLKGPVRTSGAPPVPGPGELVLAGPGVYDPVGPKHPAHPAETLHSRAAQVLEGNWTGASTVPSRGLYPHQWSWDSALTAIGYARYDQERATSDDGALES